VPAGIRWSRPPERWHPSCFIASQLATDEEGHVKPGNQEAHRERHARVADDGIGQALHEMRDGLTVIHAYAQLLQRRIHPEQPVEQDPLLARLAIIERVSMRMETRLRQLDRHHAPDP
jgi:signal transduction histidine kinase